MFRKSVRALVRLHSRCNQTLPTAVASSTSSQRTSAAFAAHPIEKGPFAVFSGERRRSCAGAGRQKRGTPHQLALRPLTFQYPVAGGAPKPAACASRPPSAYTAAAAAPAAADPASALAPRKAKTPAVAAAAAAAETATEAGAARGVRGMVRTVPRKSRVTLKDLLDAGALKACAPPRVRGNCCINCGFGAIF